MPLMAQTDAHWVLDHGQINRLIHPRSIRNNISALSIATSSTLVDKTTDCSGDPRRQMASFACDHSAESWGGRPGDGTYLLDTWAAIFQPPEPPCPSQSGLNNPSFDITHFSGQVLPRIFLRILGDKGGWHILSDSHRTLPLTSVQDHLRLIFVIVGIHALLHSVSNLNMPSFPFPST